jgi:hypothetical protein
MAGVGEQRLRQMGLKFLRNGDVMRMSMTSIIKSAVVRTLQCQHCLFRGRALSRVVAVPPRCHVARYATQGPPPSRKKFDFPEEHTEEVFNALANNPSVMQAMHYVIEAFNRRGIALDHEPSVSEMWTIMKDKQIMDALMTCTPQA